MSDLLKHQFELKSELKKMILDKKRNKINKKNAKTGEMSPLLGLPKNQVGCPVVSGLRNPKLVSDLKSDLCSKSYDGGPNF